MAQNAVLRPSLFLVFAIATAVRADLSVGTDFVFAFHCSFDGDIPYSPSIMVVNTNESQVAVTVTSSQAGFTPILSTVQAFSALQINFTDTQANVRVCDQNVVKQNGLRVRTSLPVALYARYEGGVSQNGGSDQVDKRQFLLLPTKMLSSQYPTADGSYYGIIVAKQNGTQLIVGGRQITLNNLDVYYSNGAVTSSNAAFAYIITCSFTKSRGSIVPDAIMAYPSSFSSTFISTSPSYLPIAVYYNVYALENNTQISINRGSNVSVAIGKPYQMIINRKGDSSTITATKPVHVFQSCQRDSAGHTIPLIDNTRVNIQETFLSRDVQFYAFGDGDDQDNRPLVTIVAPLEATGKISLDNKVISALQYRRIPNTSTYYYEQFLDSPAMLHTISPANNSYTYLASVMGYLKAYMIALDLPVNA